MSLATDVSVRVRPIWHAEFVQAVVDAAEPFVPTAKPEKKEVEETTDWLRAFLGFLKMGGSPSHHGFQYVSMLIHGRMEPSTEHWTTKVASTRTLPPGNLNYGIFYGQNTGDMLIYDDIC
jgi:hypothetical protein